MAFIDPTTGKTYSSKAYAERRGTILKKKQERAEQLKQQREEPKLYTDPSSGKTFRYDRSKEVTTARQRGYRDVTSGKTYATYKEARAAAGEGKVVRSPMGTISQREAIRHRIESKMERGRDREKAEREVQFEMTEHARATATEHQIVLAAKTAGVSEAKLRDKLKRGRDIESAVNELRYEQRETAIKREKELYESKEFKEIKGTQEAAKIKKQIKQIPKKGLQDIPVYYAKKVLTGEKMKEAMGRVAKTRPYSWLSKPLPEQQPGSLLSKEFEETRERAIEKATQWRIGKIKKTDVYFKPTKLGELGKLEYKEITPKEFRAETREFGETAKGFSTGVTTELREKPFKFAAIAGASYLTTGLIAPAIKLGGATAILKAPIARPIKYIGKGLGYGVKAGLGGAYVGMSVMRIKAAQTPYARGKVLGAIGTELGAITAGGYLGMRYGVRPIQRLATYRAARVEALERADLAKLMAKTEPIAMRAYKVRISPKKFKALSPRMQKLLARREVLFGARGQKLWMKKGVKWSEPGTIQRYVYEKGVVLKGKPRVMKDVDVFLRPFETKASFIARAKKLGFRVDPHTFYEYKLRSIPGVSRRPVKIAGGYKVMYPGEQVFRKGLGLSAIRDKAYYRFGKDFPDFVAGSESLLGAKAVKGIKGWMPMKKPEAAWWVGKTPKVALKDFAKTIYSSTQPAKPYIFPVSYKSYISSRPYYPPYSKSYPSYSPSTYLYRSPSTSLSRSPSPSYSPSFYRSPSYSPSYSPSSYISRSPSPSPSYYPSYSPSGTTTTPPPPMFFLRFPKGKKITIAPKKKPKRIFRETPTLHFAVAPKKYKVAVPKLKGKRFTGLEERA
jgi:hypothetical protein